MWTLDHLLCRRYTPAFGVTILSLKVATSSPMWNGDGGRPAIEQNFLENFTDTYRTDFDDVMDPMDHRDYSDRGNTPYLYHGSMSSPVPALDLSLGDADWTVQDMQENSINQSHQDVSEDTQDGPELTLGRSSATLHALEDLSFLHRPNEARTQMSKGDRDELIIKMAPFLGCTPSRARVIISKGLKAFRKSEVVQLQSDKEEIYGPAMFRLSEAAKAVERAERRKRMMESS